MDSILALVLAIALREAIPKEELRFAYGFSQEAERGCGLAATASLLSLYCSIPAREGGLEGRLDARSRERAKERGLALADIALLLRQEGLEARAYRMELGQIEAALDSGFSPVVVHYDRPSGHFALLLAHVTLWGSWSRFCMADSARGLEALSAEEFRGRWSGAVLLVDPASLSPAGRERLARAAKECAERLMLLARGEASRAALRAASRGGAPP